jgi:hypothetical protein
MSNHLLIAGTGRAGTSFLVRYLTALGLDTTLSRQGDVAAWDEHANAGLEDIPMPEAEGLPYVIKSPWTYQVIAETLARGKLLFDAAIVPMRDLAEAAASRSILETRAIHREAPWMADLGRSWDHYGRTPGGTVYSTSPADQARLLAVGFHHLLERLVAADVPLVMLSFPRLVEDGDYLFRKLAPVLPATVTGEDARRAHAAVADSSKVRVGRPQADAAAEAADRAALARLLQETRAQLYAAQAQLQATQAQLATVTADLDGSPSAAQAAPRGSLFRRVLGR